MKQQHLMTDIEQQLLAAEKALPAQLSALQSWRAQQQKALQTMGLPSRRVEDWRSFPWARLKVSDYAGPDRVQPLQQNADWVSRLPVLNGSDLLVFVDGHYAPQLSHCEALPAGVVSLPWSEAVHSPQVIARLTNSRSPQSGWQLLNDLLLNHGWYLAIPAGVSLSRPLQILNVTTNASEGVMQHPHFMVQVGAGASANIMVNNWTPAPIESVLVNQQISLDLAESAVCNWVNMQQEDGVQRVGHMVVQQQESSQFSWQHMGLAARWVRDEMRVQVQGENTETAISALLMPQERQYMALHTYLQHDKPNTQAMQRVRSIVADEAVAQFQGRVHVQPGAVKTVSTQYSENLLIDPRAEVKTCPQLEIYADDVVCTHGATIGDLDPQQLFYLRARGLSTAQAKRILLKGFAQAVFSNQAEPLFHQVLLGTLVVEWAKRLRG